MLDFAKTATCKRHAPHLLLTGRGNHSLVCIVRIFPSLMIQNHPEYYQPKGVSYKHAVGFSGSALLTARHRIRILSSTTHPVRSSLGAAFHFIR